VSNRQGIRKWADLSMTAPLIGSLAYVLVTTGRMILREPQRVPFWDQWLFVLPEQYLGNLFAQHNEHRIPLARIVFALDTYLFSGAGRLSQGAVFSCLLLTAALLARSVRRAARSRLGALQVFAFGTTALFSAYSWENLVWTFQFSFVSVFPAAVGAFLAVARPAGGRGSLLLAAGCAALATYSGASGIFVAPLLIVLAVLAGRPRSHAIAMAGVTAALLIAYLAGYERPPRHADPMATIRDPALWARYLVVYLGAPLSARCAEHTGILSAVFGGAGLTAWAVTCVHAVARRRRRDPAAWVPVCTMTFIVGTAFLTALGRSNFGVAQASSSRYGTPSFVFWSSLFAYGMLSTERLRARLGVVALASVVAVGIASEQQAHEDTARAYLLGRTQDAETALLSGGLDVAAVDRVAAAPWRVERSLPELRRRHLSVFSQPWAQWLHWPLSRFVSERNDAACLGSIDVARPVPAYGAPAFRFEGWVSARDAGASPERIVVIDSRGRVIGFATAGRPRPDVPKAFPYIQEPRVGFVGHVGRLKRRQEAVQLVAIMGDGRTACHFGASITLDRATAQALVRP